MPTHQRPTTAELAWARRLYPHADWSGARIEDGGQFHRVLIAPDHAVLRIARTAEQADLLPRRMALLRALAPELPFALPEPLGDVDRQGERAAVVQRFLPGAAHPVGTGDPGALRAILEALAGVRLQPLRALLAEPFAYAGPWTTQRIRGLLAALDAPDAAAAEPVLAEILAMEERRRRGLSPTGLVHGDLAGHNLHWRDGQLIGILDWDLASAWDPALNLAYLSLWHGREVIDALTDSEHERIRVVLWRAALVLEVLDHCRRTGDHARFAERVRRRFGRVRYAAAALARR